MPTGGQFKSIIDESDYIPEPTNGCWLWTRSLHKNGYARVVRYGYPSVAHRAMWAQTYGPIPTGLCVCHKCDVRSCINPEHLFLGTKSDNNRDKVMKGRQARNGSTCRRDHLYMGAFDTEGYRMCLTCRRVSYTKHDRKRRYKDA